MAELATQFSKAKSNVEATADDKANAKAAHTDVRARLEADPILKSYGIDTVLIGSYKRNVAIRRVKDVDILSKLPDIRRDVGPRQLLGYFARVLEQEYGGDRIEAQRRSVKVEFPKLGLAVDVVPARRCLSSNYIEIPDRAGGWQQTNPERLTELTTAMNDRYEGEYVPLVKLIRQTRRHNLGKRPGGFYFEILTYHSAQAGLDQASPAALFTSALKGVADWLRQAALGVQIPDPTMPAESISIRATPAQMSTAAARFAELARKADEALNAERCPSAKIYREILGKNTDDVWVFETPAGCNPDGTSKNLDFRSPGDRTIPAGGGRFA